MAQEIRKDSIQFQNGNEAIALFPHLGAKTEDIIQALAIDAYRAVILVMGGADDVNEKVKPRLIQLFSRGIARAAADAAFLAAVNQQVWIALTTAIVAVLTTYLGYRQTESSLRKYKQAKTNLENVKAWWLALSPEEQARPDNINALVEHTEQVLESELGGWLKMCAAIFVLLGSVSCFQCLRSS